MTTLTDKQKNWIALKAANRLAAKVKRAVPVPAHVPRPRTVTGRCQDCPHGWKHHSAAGRCRRDCTCRNGADR